MFVPDVPDQRIKFYSQGEKWNIAVTASSKSTGSLNTVSFVNNTSTSRGGTHVNYILDQVAPHFVEIFFFSPIMLFVVAPGFVPEEYLRVFYFFIRSQRLLWHT